jgi:hypothetical protein
MVQLLLLTEEEGAVLALLKLIIHVIQDEACGEEIKVNFCIMVSHTHSTQRFVSFFFLFF